MGDMEGVKEELSAICYKERMISEWLSQTRENACSSSLHQVFLIFQLIVACKA